MASLASLSSLAPIFFWNPAHECGPQQQKNACSARGGNTQGDTVSRCMNRIHKRACTCTRTCACAHTHALAPPHIHTQVQWYQAEAVIKSVTSKIWRSLCWPYIAPNSSTRVHPTRNEQCLCKPKHSQRHVHEQTCVQRHMPRPVALGERVLVNLVGSINCQSY